MPTPTPENNNATASRTDKAVVCDACVRPLHFRGHDLDASKVLSIDPTDSHSIGTMNCQWNYGFTVRFPGSAVNILLPQPSQYGYSGGPSREQYKALADKMRVDFLQLLWPNARGQTPGT